MNILRVFGVTLAAAFIGQFTAVRGRFHAEMLLDNAGTLLARLPADDSAWTALGGAITREASILATADIYRILALLALFMIPFVLKLQYAPAPVVQRTEDR